MAQTSTIISFLSQLKENNQREWMAENKALYQEARQEFSGLVQDILAGFRARWPEFSELNPKDCIFRLHRDVRFSADKSPYKTWMAAWFAPGGKKSVDAGYYLHLQPGNESMFAAGLHQPAPEQLRKVRQEIDYNATELREISQQADFQQEFGLIQGEKLKRAPKGYQPSHPQIELLKLKSYLVIHKLTDGQLQQNSFIPRINELSTTAQPFVEYLNVAIS